MNVRKLIAVASLSLLAALFSFQAARPVAAQEVVQDEGAAYRAFHEASQAGDTAKALDAAKAYLEKYPAGQYAEFIKKWQDTAQMTLLDTAIKEKRTADMIKAGEQILAKDPENLNVIYALAFNIRRNELLVSPPVYTNAAAAVDFAKRGIALVESGKTLTGVASFDKGATLAWMTQILAINEGKNGSDAEAIKLYEKSTAFAPSDPLVARNLLAVVSLRQGNYAERAKAYNALPEADRAAAEPTARGEGGQGRAEPRGRRAHRRRRGIRGLWPHEGAAARHGRPRQPAARDGLQGPLPRGRDARRAEEDPGRQGRAGRLGRRGRYWMIVTRPATTSSGSGAVGRRRSRSMPGVAATNATISSSVCLTGGGVTPVAIRRLQNIWTSTSGCCSTSAANDWRTGERIDWSTGSTGDPSPQRGACLRKIELSVARGIWDALHARVDDDPVRRVRSGRPGPATPRARPRAAERLDDASPRQPPRRRTGGAPTTPSYGASAVPPANCRPGQAQELERAGFVRVASPRDGRPAAGRSVLILDGVQDGA